MISFAGIALQTCSQIEDVRNIIREHFKDAVLFGVVDYNNSDFLSICQLILPDLTIFIVSIVILVLSYKFHKPAIMNDEYLRNVTVETTEVKNRRPSSYSLMNNFFILISLMTLCVCGAICATLVNVLYFSTFLASGMYIASNHKLGKRFFITLKIVSIIMILQAFGIILYQLKYFQELIPADTLEARLFGLYAIFSMTESGIRFEGNLNFDFMLHPLVLISSYLILANIPRILGMDVKKFEKLSENNDGQKSRFSVENYIPSYIKSLIFRQAYIAAIISMMIWSIVYHSWLGFIFLMISNGIFIQSNQRIRMIKMSPFVATYACMLILLNYVYGLNLTDNEMASSDSYGHVNMEQIGIIRYDSYNGTRLLLKSILTVPFWIVMRQKYDPRTSEIYLNTQIEENKFSTYVLKPFLKFLTFSLMWIIVLLVFIMSVYEYNQMSIFRISNMIFFVVYMLTFQLSIKLWKKIMYIYWIALIFYTTAVLILTYVFQFDGFWELPYHAAIGLKKYKTSELFLKLLSLITITILSGFQLNYCHLKFINFLDNSQIVRESPLEAPESNEDVVIKVRMIFSTLFEKK